jgi:dipeptidyl aminopeptidase/acylaminoacyl peptidase
MLKGQTETGFEEGYHSIYDPRFENGDKQRVQVPFIDHGNKSYRRTEYKRVAGGTWQVTGRFDNPSETGHSGLEVFVKQSLNDPPLLVVKNKQASRVILDPNPQLKGIALVEASIYTWKSKEGRPWKGGLFKPNHYREGQRYPLVIQTHGFTEGEFRPSGVFPTAFAARALASTGIVVLQTAYPLGALCPVGTPEEDDCWVSTYEGAINQLVADGLVDSQRVGIIGFSHSCEGVMKVLTTSPLPIKAASITDGVMTSYLQSMLTLDFHGNAIAKFGNSVVGAQPFGEGLQQWFKRSSGFNLDKVNTPLLVVGEGPQSLLTMMWEPYAGLRYLKKPVDLLMLNTDEHVLTNPGVRMASQGGSVDWFRFWLQDYEDPDPAKAKEYARWRELRKLQEENERKITTLPK